MRFKITLLASLIALSGLAGTLAAQSTSSSQPKQQDEKGIRSFVVFGGSANSAGHILELDSSLGYDFSRHVAVDFGLPIYFAGSSSSVAGRSASSNGVGDPRVDLRLTFENPVVNYRTVLTGTAPLGSVSRGFSTGRATYDWTNRFDRSFSRLTPFAELGISNTIADSAFFRRPFTTLGFNSHYRAGADLGLGIFSVGAAAYAIVPSGQQKVFSRLVQPGVTGLPGVGRHGRVFETRHETIGSAGIARDNGFSTWVDAGLSRYVNLEVAYARSVHYALDTVSFGVGLNLGALARRKSGQTQ